MGASNSLVTGSAQLWEQIVAHPFVAAAGEGTLPREAFDRWLVQDHFFVVGFRRFLAELRALAPDDGARALLDGGLDALEPELALFRAEAEQRGLDLDAEPSPTTLGYTAFVQASVLDGFAHGLVVLYGAEKAYLDAWTAVRERTASDSPYARFIDNWSSPAFAGYVASIAGLLDATLPAGPDEELARLFARVVRFELRFWDAVHEAETW